MPLYVISYDLREQRDYDSLINQLDDWRCIRPLWSVWLGSLKGPAAAIRDILRKHIDEDDGLMIVELKGDSDWASVRLLPGGAEWLTTHTRH